MNSESEKETGWRCHIDVEAILSGWCFTKAFFSSKVLSKLTQGCAEISIFCEQKTMEKNLLVGLNQYCLAIPTLLYIKLLYV